jgi:hypothetical protein
MTVPSISSAGLFSGTSLARLAFAGNSVLYRLALTHTLPLSRPSALRGTISRKPSPQ